jgi:hypothetical protein
MTYPYANFHSVRSDQQPRGVEMMINLAAPLLRVFRCFSGEKKCELDAPKHTNTRTYRHTQALALFCIYRYLECVSAAAHSRSLTVYILHTSIYTLCECLGLNDAYRVFF